MVRVCRWLPIFLVLCPMAGFAKPVGVFLNKIKVNKVTEEGGDELYLSIISTIGEKSTQHRVPRFPEHWKSQQLNKVKDVPLWSGEVAKDTQCKMVISLQEHDMPPWLVDDHLGSVELIMSNDNDKINFVWQESEFNHEVQVKQVDEAKPKFEFISEFGSYSVEFKVSES